ncbi:MAG: LysM peptidoglycan-binding domain-containing protein [Anaerolineae bacterium]
MRKLISIILLSALLTIAGITAAQESDTSYTVQRGDTIAGIAAAFGVDADALLIANNIIDPNRIRVGQVLTIPTGALTVPRSHVVQPGETLNDIAIRYNTTVEALVATNTLAQPNRLIVGQVLTLPPVGGPATFPRTYRVEIGDTLRSIGEQYGVTWQQIAAFNNIATPNYVQAGTLINIPPADYVIPTPPVSAPPATGGPTTPTTPTTPTVVQPTLATYVVQRGDVLEGIAQRFNVTIESLRQLNGLAPRDAIFPGDVLTIPPTGGAVNPVVQPVTTTRTAINGVYTVQAGDTLFAIANSFRVNVYALAQANGLLNLNSIFSGQRLVIPG